MNIPLTLTLSLLAGLLGNVCKKFYTLNKKLSVSGGFIFNAITSITAGIVLLCWGGFGNTSTFTILLGIAFGVVTALQGITNIVALQWGPMSYTSVIISFSTIISALSGVAFFNESLHWPQIVGIVFMLASFVLATKKDDSDKKTNFKWFIMCLIAFFATGFIGVMQKVHQTSTHATELSSFLIIAFLTSAILCSIFAIFFKKPAQQDDQPSTSKKLVFLIPLAVTLVCGICVAVNNKFNLYLSGVINSAVFFPIVNGGGLILTTLAALLLFREKLTLKQWIGLTLGIISVIFLCNPFA